jgi:outer membrane protein assembly factor BamB
LATGEQFYPKRLGGVAGSFSASPVAADGKIYCASEDGDVYVVKAGPEYQELSKNAIGEVIMATPAISDGLIIIRGLKNVYAIKAQ